MTTGFDPPLIIVAVIGAVLALACALRVVLVYGHPDDSRSAWLPRGVATAAFALAAWTVLLLPLDVAARRACDTAGISAVACGAAAPAAALWRSIAVAGAVVAFAIVPIAYFYYLGDSEDPPSRRVLGALGRAAATAAIAGGSLGLAYSFGGVADVPVTVLASGFVRANAVLPPGALDVCVAPPAAPTDPLLPSTPSFAGRACDAVTGSAAPTLWSVRVTLLTYVLAL